MKALSPAVRDVDSHRYSSSGGAWASAAVVEMRPSHGGASCFPSTASNACGQCTSGGNLQLCTGVAGEVMVSWRKRTRLNLFVIDVKKIYRHTYNICIYI